MKKLALILFGLYIFSCSGEHSTKEESATTDSSAVVKDTIEVVDSVDSRR